MRNKREGTRERKRDVICCLADRKRTDNDIEQASD